MNDIALIQGRLEDYRCTSAEEEMNAIREILQELILAGLSRADFFVKAAFHGGTQLRIFEGVRRFSEDLDFALVSHDQSFQLLPYLEKVSEELSAIGVTMEVRDKSKASVTVKKGFLKTDSMVKILDLRFVGGRGTLGTPPKISIKMEVDSNPPAGATYKAQQLLFPIPASVRVFDRESAFSGKMHALLCRQYIKGRDWFDFVWYAGVKAKLNHELLSSAIDQQGPWAGKGIVTSDEWVRERLMEVIAKMDWSAAKRDVMPFVYATDRMSLDLWGGEFFSSLAERLF
jgi:hypothetical protein